MPLRRLRNSGLEPEVIASIKRARRKQAGVRTLYMGTLIFGLAAAMVVFIVRVVQSSGAVHGTDARGWIPLITIAALYILFVLIVKPDKVPIADTGGDSSLNSFRSELEAVSLAVGLSVPYLKTVDIPTVNAISFKQGMRNAVGVTGDALKADLPKSCKEAMMAHEISHILTGDVPLGSSRVRWIVIGSSLAAFFILPFVFLALSFGFSVWLYAALVGWTLFDLYMMAKTSGMLYLHNDLLADSIAAKIIHDPEAVREAILLVEELGRENDKPFPTTSMLPDLLFVYDKSRKIVVDEEGGGQDVHEVENNIKSGKAGDDRRASTKGSGNRVKGADIGERIRNLEAIERGHWIEFEYSSKGFINGWFKES